MRTEMWGSILLCRAVMVGMTCMNSMWGIQEKSVKGIQSVEEPVWTCRRTMGPLLKCFEWTGL